MLKSLYDHFVILYEKILPTNPTLASEHALKQEQEVYAKSNKLTYRNVCSREGTVRGLLADNASTGSNIVHRGPKEAAKTHQFFPCVCGHRS